MPLFEYNCPKCEKSKEFLVKNKNIKVVCSECSVLMQRVEAYSNASILKGPGFHKNDYPKDVIRG